MLQSMTGVYRHAYLAYEHAESKKEKSLTDDAAYDFLEEHGCDNKELIGYELPDRETWKRNLRHVRKALGEQKHQRRGAPRLTRSIVASDQL